ncbi:MAG: hypothetical protein IAG13_36945 [Deltaproteobacteria bacterium]|nr:hypothetical protein [Nannocystaceae bacterium]
MLRSLALVLMLVPACADETDPTLEFRDDDFSGVDPEPWQILHADLADASIVGQQLRLRPDANTVWYGNAEAFHQFVMVTGDFAMTSHVSVGNLQGGAAALNWRLGGLLVRDPGAGAIDAYHTAFGTMSAAQSNGMVVEYKSTVGGASTMGFQTHPSGSGELRICRVGASLRAMYRADGANGWTLLDERQRADLPATLAAGPMAYAYAPTGDFEARFDGVDFDTLDTMADCASELPESDDDDVPAPVDPSGANAGEDPADDVPPPPAAPPPASPPPDDDAPSATLPDPTATCPAFHDGINTLCPAALGGACRNINVINSGAATGDGPLQIHWHGTYESPEGVLAWDSAAQAVRSMTIAQGGVMVLPYADPAAPARSGPFPWWIVGNATDPAMHTDRDDDFVLFDEIVACMLDAGLADPERINTSGMSAGGIMTSHLVERRGFLASAVSWSGGLPVEHQPVVPAGPTSVMVMHGGDTDQYCGPGTPPGVACYDFVPPSAALAAGVRAAGNWSFLCDHQAGHSTAMGGEGAQFMSLASFGAHPWNNYPFGSGGHWMLDHYCYAVGDESPWQ